MSAFTPGPWVIFFFDGVASSVMPAMRPGDICTLGGCMTAGERNHNARLISAAPCLLEALIEMVRVDDASYDLTAMEYGKQLCAAKDKARAAIAKAGAQ